MVVLGALLPSLLELLGFQPNIILRGASALTGTVVLVFNATYPARRRAATGAAMPQEGLDRCDTHLHLRRGAPGKCGRRGH